MLMGTSLVTAQNHHNASAVVVMVAVAVAHASIAEKKVT